jgi:hypothetical protein
LANPFPEDHMFLPISFITYTVCAFVPVTSLAARDNGSSYAKVADMSEKKPPSANPDHQLSVHISYDEATYQHHLIEPFSEDKIP